MLQIMVTPFCPSMVKQPGQFSRHLAGMGYIVYGSNRDACNGKMRKWTQHDCGSGKETRAWREHEDLWASTRAFRKAAALAQYHEF